MSKITSLECCQSSIFATKGKESINQGLTAGKLLSGKERDTGLGASIVMYLVEPPLVKPSLNYRSAVLSTAMAVLFSSSLPLTYLPNHESAQSR